jgi:hypothetical protein
MTACAHCWEAVLSPVWASKQHADCKSCCGCGFSRVSLGIGNCSRCTIGLTGHPAVFYVELKVGAGHRWNMNLCSLCREWLNETIRRFSVMQDVGRIPADSGPRIITLPEDDHE